MEWHVTCCRRGNGVVKALQQGEMRNDIDEKHRAADGPAGGEVRSSFRTVLGEGDTVSSQMSPIDVAMGFDANYAPHAAGVIASVIVLAPDAKFRFIILHDSIAAELQRQMEKCAPKAVWVWVEVKESDLPPFADRQYFNRTTLFRLGLEKLAPADCHRVVYLDSDIALLRDVRDLYNADLKGEPVGAVLDAYLDPVEFAARWNLEPGGNYMNAGVLLVDLDAVRREQLFSRAADFIALHDKELPYNDQDALSWALWKKWLPLEPVWNVQRHMAMPEIVHEIPESRRLNGRRPALIHFLGAEKPWHAKAWHPWAWAYWRSLGRTTFLEQVSRKNGVSRLMRFRMWLRWLRRGPAQTSKFL